MPKFSLSPALALVGAALLAGCPGVPVVPDPDLPTPRPSTLVDPLGGFLQDPTDPNARMTVRLRVLGATGPLVAAVRVGADEWTTAADGTVDIDDLPTADAVLARVSAPGYFPGTARLSFSALGGRSEVRVVLRAAAAQTGFTAADGANLARGAFAVAIAPGSLRLPAARDEVYDGGATVGMDIVVSEGQLITSDGQLKQRFDLYGLPVSGAGPFLARDEGGTLHHVVPLSAATVSVTSDAGDELILDAAQPAQVSLTPNRLADGLNLTMQGGLFASSGDEVGSYIPCTPGEGGAMTCTTEQGGIAALLGQIDSFVGCAKVVVALRIPEGAELLSRVDTLEAVLPTGQLLPVETRYALVDGALRLSGAHSPGRIRLRTHLVFQDRDGEGQIVPRVANVISADLVAGTIPMDTAWEGVDDVHAACAASDFTGVATVEQVLPDFSGPVEEGEPITPAPPDPIDTCAEACAKIDSCATFPSPYGETMDDCVAQCGESLTDDAVALRLIFECLEAASCEAAAIAACAEQAEGESR